MMTLQERKEQLLQEQQQILTLQQKTAIRLTFLAGALAVLQEIENNEVTLPEAALPSTTET